MYRRRKKTAVIRAERSRLYHLSIAKRLKDIRATTPTTDEDYVFVEPNYRPNDWKVISEEETTKLRNHINGEWRKTYEANHNF